MATPPPTIALPADVLVAMTEAIGDLEAATARMNENEARRDAAAVERERVYRDIADEHLANVRARRDVRARADAEKLEGYAAWKKVLMPIGASLVGALGWATLQWLSARYGAPVAPPAREAPTVPAPHDAVRTPTPEPAEQDAPQEHPHAD